jgi:hypothetical protein
MTHYKEAFNSKLEYQNYLFTIVSFKKKINIAKIRTNSPEIHDEIERWIRPRTPWKERICKVCNFIKAEDEKLCLLERTTYIEIKTHFKNICNTTNIYNVLTHENQNELNNLIICK